MVKVSHTVASEYSPKHDFLGLESFLATLSTCSNSKFVLRTIKERYVNLVFEYFGNKKEKQKAMIGTAILEGKAILVAAPNKIHWPNPLLCGAVDLWMAKRRYD